MTLLEQIEGVTDRELSIPVLETERLVLRAPRLEDAKILAQLANDRRIAENTTRIPHPYKVSDAESFIATVNNGGEFAFVITLDDEPIGACGLAQLDGPEPDLGYWLGAPFWGNGYATEAARGVIDYAFSTGGYETIQSGARVTNPASRRVLEKCGFQWMGVGLYRIRAINSSAPIDRFRLDYGIWASLKSWGKMRLVV
jgi:RimJ/RimL family protein N-acetyltransferase